MADAASPAPDLEAVHRFWFEECQPKQWYGGGPEFDAHVRDRFGPLHAEAAHSALFAQRTTARRRLAEVILLDQFSRNIHRGTARAFASDPLALGLAQDVVARGLDVQLTDTERHFLYMPYMHSESLAVHDESVRLFTALGRDDGLDYAIRHRAVIERFGRYPMRNAALGRANTPEEEAYIAERAGRAF